MNKLLPTLRALTFSLLAAGTMPATAQPIPLYKMGPDADSSFLRFLDGTGGGVTASLATGTVTTTTAQQISTPYAPVQSKWPVQGLISKGGRSVPVELPVQPGEFISVVAVSKPDGLSWSVLREQPDDFNAFKTSVGFANLAGAQCPEAGLKVVGPEVFLFEQAPADTLLRRLINPVKLTVQLICAGQPVGSALPLGQLDAGERYSVLAVPEAAGARLLLAHDKMAP